MNIQDLDDNYIWLESDDTKETKLAKKSLSLKIGNLETMRELSDLESLSILGGFCLGGADPTVDPHWCVDTIGILLEPLGPLNPY